MVAGCHVKPEQFHNLIFGYQDVYRQLADENVGVDGSLAIGFTWVPTDEIWVLQAVYMRQETANRGGGEISIVNSDGTFYLLRDDSLEAWIPLLWSGAIVMKNNDAVLCYVWGANSGDRITAGVRGYKMKITQ